MGRRAALAGLVCALAAAGGCDDGPRAGSASPDPAPDARGVHGWTDAERALLESLSLAALPPAPPQPSNRVADDPVAAELGHRLFFDPGLSRDGSVSCATCHEPERNFTDGRATSRGLADTARNAPTLVGGAWSPWQFWDGRRDSLWAQALAPLETGAEMGSTRAAVVRHVARTPVLSRLYTRAFGEPPLRDAARLPARAGPFGEADERDAWHRLPATDRDAVDRAFANVGKAIEAYERRLAPAPSRFDRYVATLRSGAEPAEAILDEQELRGLRLFLDAGRTLCLRCHNGPLLTNQSFHHVGTAQGGPVPDFGRFLGIQAVLVDPFNCLGSFSDARPEQCRELRFLNKAHVGGETGKFKTPTLRGLPRTGPYLHDGRFATLDQVIGHYRAPPRGDPASEITPLAVDDAESRALVAFLGSLDGGVAADERWTHPPR